MQPLVLKQKDNGSYESVEHDLTPLGDLGIICWILDDLKTSTISFLRSWALSAVNGDYTGTNLFFYDKREDKIFVSFEWADEDDEEDSDILILSVTSFLNILDDWEKVCKEKPKEVIITEENGKYAFEKKF